MNSNKLLFLVIIGLIFTDCGSSKVDNLKNMERDTLAFEAPISNLKISIPEGWRRIEDNKNRLFEIWLVNAEYNASIGFIPISIDPVLDTVTFNEKLELSAEIILGNKMTANGDIEIISDNYENSGMPMHILVYRIEDKLQKSIIFGRDEHLYESLAHFTFVGSENDSIIRKTFDDQEIIVKNAVIED